MEMTTQASVTRLRARRTTPPTIQPRVLYVDDESIIARAFSRSMRRRGFHVDVAQSAREAMSMVESGHYDVLVTDLSMPETDGLTLISQLAERGVEMGFVLATGHGELYVRGEYQLTGPEIHIVDKPWNDVALAELLRRLAAEHTRHAVQAC